WASDVPLVRRLVTEHRLGHQLAGRFVAGDRLEDALRAAGDLGAQGIGGILDHLGENVPSAAHAAEATNAYVEAVERIATLPGLDCMVSVKLTQLGLDVSADLCREHVRAVLEAAVRSSPSPVVMIDMEASRYVEPTVDVYLGLRDAFPNLGLCV